MTEAQRIAKQYEIQHRNYEKRIRPIFLRALQDQLQPVINWVGQMQSIEPPLDLLLNSAIFRLPMIRAYEMVGITAARREYYYQKGVEDKALIDFLINKWRELFRNYAEDYAYRIENELTETTKQAVRDALKEANELGLNADRTATLIKRSVQGQVSRTRATLIARTEATTASNLGKETGAKEYFQEIGQDGYKQWLGRNDGRERHTHVELNNDIIPMSSDWQVGSDSGAYPGDTRLSAKERCNCRCSQLFMTARRYDRMQENN